MSWRKDVSNIGDSADDPVIYCEKLIGGFRSKADHNKTEAQLTFAIVVFASLASPVFVTLGQGLWLGKVLPACLSLAAAAATSWLQLRKPQKLWTLYRQSQRMLEDQLTRHRYHITPYDEPNPDQRLAKECADVALSAHFKWEGLVPNSDALEISVSGSQSYKVLENK